MMNPEDRRVLRTRRLLKQALIELTEEQTFAEITIRDITDRADIGYATFFRHYDGKDELMLEIFTSIIAELESLPGGHGENYFEQEGYLLFKHVSENQAMYRSILDSHSFSRKLREHVKRMVQRHLDQHAQHLSSPAIPLEVTAQHMVSSLLGIVDWWLAQGLPYSIDQMALIYERLIIRATWYALEEDHPLD
jgi:AcrR family transcriptional regulator